MKRFKIMTAMFVVVVTLMGTACPKTQDLLKKLSDTIALFEPFVQSLDIIPEKLKPIIADGKDIVKLSSDLATEFGAATTRAQKFAAANKAQLELVKIIDRGHFAVDARVMGIVKLISAAFSSVANFYSDAPQASNAPKMSEKEFMADLDAKIETLKSEMKQ